MESKFIKARARALAEAEGKGLVFADHGQARFRRGACSIVFAPILHEIEASIEKWGSVELAAADLQCRGLLPAYADAAKLRSWLASRRQREGGGE